MAIPTRISQSMFDDDWVPEIPSRSLVGYSYREPRFRAELSIEKVIRYTLEDDANIGGGDVYDTTYENGLVTIECCQPVIIVAEVTELSARLAISDIIADATITEVLPGGVQVIRPAKEMD